MSLVVLGVDPHNQSHTATALIDGLGCLLDLAFQAGQGVLQTLDAVHPLQLVEFGAEPYQQDLGEPRGGGGQTGSRSTARSPAAESTVGPWMPLRWSRLTSMTS
jgi:hypothetical protein